MHALPQSEQPDYDRPATRLTRCGTPAGEFETWVRKHGRTGLRVATYYVSQPSAMPTIAPLVDSLRLLVGIAPSPGRRFSIDAELSPSEKWSSLLSQLEPAEQAKVLVLHGKLLPWLQRGADVRVAVAGVRGAQCTNAMHLKAYIAADCALVGSANFTSKGLLSDEQSESLVDVNGQAHAQLSSWFEQAWNEAWTVAIDSITINASGTNNGDTPSEETTMGSGARQLLGHWLGVWGAWALNGNGVVAYPHQLQAVDWIKADGRSYLLGDEVGLGKTYTAALLWLRHRMLYGDRARLIYITKPSLLIDAISAFVDVLGVEEFLKGPAQPTTAGQIQPQFGILHMNTKVWDIVPDEYGRRREKDHPIKGLLNEGRYRIRPFAFAERLGWINHHAAAGLHEAITLRAPKQLVDNAMTFVSIDTLRGRLETIPHVFERVATPQFATLLIVDESHGIGRDTDRRRAIARLIWGEKGGEIGGLYDIPGTLAVYMTGTPIHPNASETVSRLGLLDFDKEKVPHPIATYLEPEGTEAKAVVGRVKTRAVLRKKENVTLDGTSDGVPIFPKRLVFPFRRWPEPDFDEADSGSTSFEPKEKDVLLAVDRYVASEASHGAKLFSLIRRVLRGGRDLKELSRLAKTTSTAKEDGTFASHVFDLATKQAQSTTGEQKLQWEAVRTAIEAAQTYEKHLKDDRLEDLTWRYGLDAEGSKTKFLFFTKAGWVSTVYDSFKDKMKRASADAEEASLTDEPDEDEDSAGEVNAEFSSARDMLDAAQKARDLANSYLERLTFDDESKVRFSMLVALLEGNARLQLWPQAYPAQLDSDRFGWGLDASGEATLRESLANVKSTLALKTPWVIHARYIHSVVDTAVRLQLRYGTPGAKPIVGIIIGDTPNHKRDEIKSDFAKGDLDIICMSDAGAEGINLQRSNRIVLLDVPVSPGRIEQIAGRVHRLGSIRAAQVTLLLPPRAFGSRVFEALRAAAGIVFKSAVGSPIPKITRKKEWSEDYYVRHLALAEAQLITAVAETSGTMRSQDNRMRLIELVNKPVTKDGKPNSAPVEAIIQQGWTLVQEQQRNFQREDVATQSDMMPDLSDLVAALQQHEGATLRTARDTYHVPESLVDDVSLPEQFGDLVTSTTPFEVLQLSESRDSKVDLWFGRKRFLPSDRPSSDKVNWLGVRGNPIVEDILKRWRKHQAPELERAAPQMWTTTTLPTGRVVALASVQNLAGRSGKIDAATSIDRQEHVLLGVAQDSDVASSIRWRPFFARGATVPRKIATDQLEMMDFLQLDHHWAAELLRKCCGLAPGAKVSEASSAAASRLMQQVVESILEYKEDDDTGLQVTRLTKSAFEEVTKAAPSWWGGGVNRRCTPLFVLIAKGPEQTGRAP